MICKGKVVEGRDIIFMFTFPPTTGTAIHPLAPSPVMHLLNLESSSAFASQVRRSVGEEEAGSKRGEDGLG